MEEISKKIDEEIIELFKILKKCREIKDLKTYEMVIQMIIYLISLKISLIEPEPISKNVISFERNKGDDFKC